MIYMLSLKRGLPARTGFIIPFRGLRSPTARFDPGYSSLALTIRASSAKLAFYVDKNHEFYPLQLAPTLRMLTEVRQSRYQPAAD